MTNRAEISAFSSVIWEWRRRLGQGRCGGCEARSYLRNSPWVMRKEGGRIRPRDRCVTVSVLAFHTLFVPYSFH
jgi:hypothetical protein